MAVFSQIVDELAVELVRPDLAGQLPGFLNQTIREAHIDIDTGSPVLYADNRFETLVTVDVVTDNSYLWTIPTVALFQGIEAIYYVGYGRYANETNPLRINDLSNMRPNDVFCFYRTGPYVAMRGFGNVGAKIKISWFQYPRSLIYYPAASRPLTFNYETLTYVQPSGATETLEEAKTKSTNWLLDRHEEMLKEGLRAKAYSRMDQEFRASTSYSKYRQLLAGVQKTESMPQGVYQFK